MSNQKEPIAFTPKALEFIALQSTGLKLLTKVPSSFLRTAA